MLEDKFEKTQVSNITQIHVNSENGVRSLLSLVNFKPNDEICNFGFNTILSKPNYLTIQIGENQHIEPIPKFLECTNHSCNPNCFFDTTNNKLIAIDNISKGKELRFFYPSSEWNMEAAFECNCESENCIGTIKGAKYLSESQRKKYRFTDFIEQKFSERNL